jgi:hypothetical protein
MVAALSYSSRSGQGILDILRPQIFSKIVHCERLTLAPCRRRAFRKKCARARCSGALISLNELKETARYLHLSQRHLHAAASPLDSLPLDHTRLRFAYSHASAFSCETPRGSAPDAHLDRGKRIVKSVVKELESFYRRNGPKGAHRAVNIPVTFASSLRWCRVRSTVRRCDWWPHRSA